jgi:hypothetical protein
MRRKNILNKKNEMASAFYLFQKGRFEVPEKKNKVEFFYKTN